MEAKLVMFRSDGQRRDIQVQPGDTVVGRSDDADLQIPLATVSRKHCTVTLDTETNTLSVKDLGSSNGTFVNDHRIHETSLEAGDLMKVGPVIFTVQLDGQPDNIAPAKTLLPADDTGDPVDHQDYHTADEEVISLEGLPREGVVEEEPEVAPVRAQAPTASARAPVVKGAAGPAPLPGLGELDFANDEPAPHYDAEDDDVEDLAQAAAVDEDPAEDVAPAGDHEEVIAQAQEELAEEEQVEEEEPEPAGDPLSALAAMTKGKPRR